MSIPQFSQSVIEQIGYYVYVLYDPRTNEPFYIGKGTGNRLFAHVHDALRESDFEEGMNPKLDKIREIHAQGLEVRHVIHRHGLDEAQAFEVEAALIDWVKLAGLTNRVMGKHSSDRGPMTMNEVISLYDAPAIQIQEPSILFLINRLYYRGIPETELYEVTRGRWVLGERRNRAQYGFAVSFGIVRGVYHIESWMPATSEDKKKSARWEFTGRAATELSRYIGGSVKHYLERNQNPCRYINC